MLFNFSNYVFAGIKNFFKYVFIIIKYYLKYVFGIIGNFFKYVKIKGKLKFQIYSTSKCPISPVACLLFLQLHITYHSYAQLCTAVQTVNCLTQLFLQPHVQIFLLHSVVIQSSKWKDVCLYLWIIDRIEKFSLFQIFSQWQTELKFSIGKIIWNTNFTS